MANTGKVQKRRKSAERVHQDISHVYRPDNLNYNTGDYTLKKTKGYDDLQKNEDERRGRKKKK